MEIILIAIKKIRDEPGTMKKRKSCMFRTTWSAPLHCQFISCAHQENSSGGITCIMMNNTKTKELKNVIYVSAKTLHLILLKQTL